MVIGLDTMMMVDYVKKNFIKKYFHLLNYTIDFALLNDNKK